MSKSKHVLSVTEKDLLKQEANEIRSGIREAKAEGFGAGTAHSVDTVKMERQAQQLERAAREGEAGSLRGANKDKVWKRSQELESKIKEGMLSQHQMGNAANARAHLEWERRNSRMINEWKQAKRRLEPNDPNASNIEQLRRRR